MLGLKRETVTISTYQENWNKIYEQTKTAIEKQLDNETIDIQHVGSTSIKKLASKPIIDMVIGLERLTEETINRIIPKLEEISIEYRGNRLDRGGYLFIKKREQNIVSHHIHVVEKGDQRWKNYLKFREVLRKDNGLAKKYEQLKIELAKKYPKNRKLYTESKAAFIRQILYL